MNGGEPQLFMGLPLAAVVAGMVCGWALCLALALWTTARAGFLAAFIMLLLTVVAILHYNIQERKGVRAPGAYTFLAETDEQKKAARDVREAVLELYIPHADSLEITSLGTPSIAADILWLTSIQYVAQEFRDRGEMRWLLRLYAAASELDPGWLDMTRLAANLLAAAGEAHVDEALAYVDAVIDLQWGEGVTPDWRLYRLAGEIAVFSPHHRDRERSYWEAFAAIPDDQLDDEGLDYKRRMLPFHLSEDSGNLAYALQLAYQCAEGAGDSTFGELATRRWKEYYHRYWQHRLTVLLNAYRAMHGGAFPPGAGEESVRALLVWEATLPESPAGSCVLADTNCWKPQHPLRWIPGTLPREWFGYGYRIDPMRQCVYSESQRIRLYNTAMALLQNLSDMLRGRDYYLKPAAHLAELFERIREKGDNGMPMETPRPPFSEVFGSQWELPPPPEGAAYHYDPLSGRLSPTPGFSLEDIYRHPIESGDVELQRTWSLPMSASETADMDGSSRTARGRFIFIAIISLSGLLALGGLMVAFRSQRQSG